MSCCFSEVPAGFPLAEVEAAVAATAGVVTAGILLVGPPGIGKTMLARRIPGILPALTEREAADLTELWRAAVDEHPGITERPFRAPHHTVSAVAMTGTPDRKADLKKGYDYRPARPGEAALSTGGVLFLDELPEFATLTIRQLADLLRQGAALGYRVRPAVVVASALPCPCGWHGSTERACVCPESAVERYAARVAEFARYLNLTTTLTLQPVTLAALRSDAGTARGEASHVIRGRVAAAWAVARG